MKRSYEQSAPNSIPRGAECRRQRELSANCTTLRQQRGISRSRSNCPMEPENTIWLDHALSLLMAFTLSRATIGARPSCGSSKSGRCESVGHEPAMLDMCRWPPLGNSGGGASASGTASLEDRHDPPAPCPASIQLDHATADSLAAEDAMIVSSKESVETNDGIGPSQECDSRHADYDIPYNQPESVY